MSTKFFKNLMSTKHKEFLAWASKTHYFSKVVDKTSTSPMATVNKK